jgi:predicted transcriptional regulator
MSTEQGSVTRETDDVPELFELEAEVMEQMWRAGKATVREVLTALNETGTKARAYTTIMTTMRRLFAKGMLERDRYDRTDTYRPKMSKDEYIHARARIQVEALVSEYGDVALVNFARQVGMLPPTKLQTLREMAGREPGMTTDD